MDNNIKNKAASLEILKEVKDKLEGDINKTKESMGMLDFLFPGTNIDDITDVDAISNTSDIVDASELFAKNNLIVRQNGYKVDKETMLALKNKNISGGGSVVWNEYKDNSYYDPTGLITGETKLDYIHDPVYMSMKEPSEAISSYLPARTSGAILYYQPEGYTNLIGIGAFYAGDQDNLPDEFTLCLGAMKTYTLSDEPNAKWILHEEHKIPKGITVYELPWTTHVSYALEDGQIEYCDNFARIHLKKKDLTDSVIHFWGSSKREIDLKHTIGIVVMYEVWTENDNLTGEVFAATGADQRIAINSGSNNVKQAMSGKNWLVKPEHRLVISHNIPDAVYDSLKYTANDPERLINEYYKVENYVEEIEKKPFYYDLPKKCIIGYAEESGNYLKICSIAYNSETIKKFVNIDFDVNIVSHADSNTKIKKEFNVIISTINDTATCTVYTEHDDNCNNAIKVCNDIENKVVNIYVEVQTWVYTNLTINHIIGYTDLVTFDDYFVSLFERESLSNIKENNLTKELIGEAIKIKFVNDSSFINISSSTINNLLRDNIKKGSNIYIINGWDTSFQNEEYKDIIPPSFGSSYYIIESVFYYNNNETTLYGKQTWTKLSTGEQYVRTIVNNVFKDWKMIVQLSPDASVEPIDGLPIRDSSTGAIYNLKITNGEIAITPIE